MSKYLLSIRQSYVSMLCIIYAFVYTESVQSSLERKFGRDGGKIPITPSPAFEQRIAVSGNKIQFRFSFFFYILK